MQRLDYGWKTWDVSEKINRKLPDRKDFERYAGDDAGRERAWRSAIAESDRLGDEFMELTETRRLPEVIRPL